LLHVLNIHFIEKKLTKYIMFHPEIIAKRQEITFYDDDDY